MSTRITRRSIGLLTILASFGLEHCGTDTSLQEGATAGSAGEAPVGTGGDSSETGGTGGGAPDSGGSGGANPGSGGADPGSGGTQPGSGGTQPGSGGTQPGAGGADPGSGGADPGAGGAGPGAGGTDPGSGGASPGGSGGSEGGSAGSVGSGGLSGTGGAAGNSGSAGDGGAAGGGGMAPGSGGTDPGTGGADPGSGGSSTGGAAGSGGAGGAGGSGGQGEFGFDYRIPQTQIPFWCDNPDFPDPIEIPVNELDWLCTFEDDGVQGYIYVQTSPVDVDQLCVPIMSVVAAQISIDGQVEPLQNAQYDWGTGHHNDFLNFDYGGKSYEYFHSSFGYGYRACQPMDCMQVDDGQTIEDGCTMERTLPVICVSIEEDGSHADLVDTFAPCPGDPNYE